MTGSFSSPKISTDMKGAVTNLTNQLVKQQKEKALKQGTSALTDYLNENTKKTSDTTKTATPTTEENVKEKAADLLKGLFNKRKKRKNPKPRKVIARNRSNRISGSKSKIASFLAMRGYLYLYFKLTTYPSKLRTLKTVPSSKIRYCPFIPVNFP